jgi:TldD protein
MLAGLPPRRPSCVLPAGLRQVDHSMTAARLAAQATRQEPTPLLALAQQAVDAARTAGAQYADVRFTRTVGHRYNFAGGSAWFAAAAEIVGVGVRVLVNGYWGFTACPLWASEPHETDSLVRLARDAVAQAAVNAMGPVRTVELSQIPTASGEWTTPVQRDPFTIPIEEKLDYLHWLMDYAQKFGVYFSPMYPSVLAFNRQERTVSTSDGARFTQTIYEIGGQFHVASMHDYPLNPTLPPLSLQGLTAVGMGWEFLQVANLPAQFEAAEGTIYKLKADYGNPKPSTIGRYTLLCDGATMAALLDRTLGVATQLDRALGYESNAEGTSFIDDPLAMVGRFRLAPPGVTVTANRSAPTQLATVKWDDEGVAPEPFTLVQDGVLVDFQTTREQTAWLAPYYQRTGKPMRSHGCAASEDALGIPLQMMPNLVLEPEPSAVRFEDLVADISKGILITDGDVDQMDQQARNGLLYGTMREITNGRLGRGLADGAVMFNSLDLWKNIRAMGGPATVGGVVSPRSGSIGNDGFMDGYRGVVPKGQPPQTTSYSVRAGAAVITDQPLVNPMRRA